MGNSVFYFDDFCLNPLARELSRNGESIALAASAFDCLVYLIEHRERPVGKDELISAVWGRDDVSDNLLAQTIVRLRRSLGDAGNEQRCIKTVPRVGYRWMLDTQVVSQGSTKQAAAQSPTSNVEAISEATTLKPLRSKQVRRPLLVALLATLGLAVAYWGWQFHQAKPAATAMHFEQGTAIVLPAVVNASADWSWLRLGLMDMLSSRLREANVPTENSRNVLNLLNRADAEGGAKLSSFALVVTPNVTLSDNTWHVHLDAKSREGRIWQAESSSANVLSAARAASDLLLAQLGFGGESKPGSGTSRQEYLLRVEAAQLAGHPDLAHELIDKAPPDVRETPEFAVIQADFHCDEGKLEPCERALNDLLKQLPADKQPLLRGRVLTSLWYIYYRKHQFAEGEAALTEAVRLLQARKDNEALALAYLDRSHLEFFDGKPDEATADLGLARINYKLAGDTVGQAKVDTAMGEIAMRRGQFDQALSLEQSAYEHYQRMGMRQLLSTPLQGLIMSHKMLLQYADELEASDRYWPFDEKNMEFCDDNVRSELVILRALALADSGRTSDASTLLQQLNAQPKPDDDPILSAWANILLARFALERGETQAAQAWIAKAFTGSALDQDDDQRDYAEAMLTKVNVLQRAGKLDELKHTVATLQAWVGHRKELDDWTDIFVLRANAAQAWSEGRREQALEQLRLAMIKADKLGVPDLIVGVGQAYALALLSAGNVDQAVAISGRLSTWSNVDWRAAWVEACTYRALGQMDAWEKQRNKAQTLAGDRMQLTEPTLFSF
ncbi:winged helix-turn-helix domain-containing protein [Dyella acidisoli]|uniref:OmpR/PhoB-type domain-containing protein n=1 Tax=Dyella acidisoli TaxID=1867834 RepID=A0ABQ5XRY2_9GAMM|nr:winged helix-turn-helix domain-containing protein [Dyella acidisoli]GLQ93255.1 hypothetical protein GCM10007901_22060 [Dyella acidisoli]